jgi:hypothetical protein
MVVLVMDLKLIQIYLFHSEKLKSMERRLHLLKLVLVLPMRTNYLFGEMHFSYVPHQWHRSKHHVF